MKYPTTPDGRYFVVKGRLWRCTNPALPKEEQERWVKSLMGARSTIRIAIASNDKVAEKDARNQVHEAKVALGERGPVWWDEGAPDYNRHMVKNTPYAAWYANLNQK